MNKEYKGRNGTLIITDTGIVISRGKRGVAFGSGGQRGDKTIPYRMLSSVQLKKGGLVYRQGYIRFSFMGGTENKGSYYSVAKDENSILFATSKNKAFEEARQIVEKNINEAIQPKASSSLDELDKLARLKQQGTITQTEFEKKKAQLLDQS
jgi:hypothetical protein